MSRKLAIISVVGFALCFVFLGLAVLIGGDDIFHDQRSLKSIKPLIDLATHKEWRWNGGDTLAVDAPINLRYQPGGLPHISVTGPADLLAHVRVGGGRIGADSATVKASRGQLEAVVSGIAIRKFVVNNGETLHLGHIDQDQLDVHINGSGSVNGEGRVNRLNLMIAGEGKADLGALSVQDARVSILGDGTAILSPHNRLQLFVAGDGQISLLTKPKSVRRTILGDGDIKQITASPTPPPRPSVSVSPPAPPAPPEVPDAAAGAVFLKGSGFTDLGRIDQDSLNVTIASSGVVRAEGRVGRLIVNVMGSGQANLGKLSADEAIVSIAGSGGATVAPTARAKITIMGSGDVRLLTRPEKIEREIIGSGRIIEGR
ncbi:MAG TPA: DUF2807 domain-containing protein [Rhizomicrobium sp.]|jgi:hypothetical protein